MRSRASLALTAGFLLGIVMQPVLLVGFARVASALRPDPRADARHVAAWQGARALAGRIERSGLPGRPPDPGATVEFRPLAARDPWGHPFVLQRSPGDTWWDVRSWGADGVPGGTGLAADVSGRLGIVAPRAPVLLDILGALVALALPTAGLAGSARRVVLRGLLAGSALIMGLAVLLCVDLPQDRTQVLPFAGAAVVALGAAAGAVGLLTRARAAAPLAAAGAGACYLLFSFLPPA